MGLLRRLTGATYGLGTAARPEVKKLTAVGFASRFTYRVYGGRAEARCHVCDWPVPISTRATLGAIYAKASDHARHAHPEMLKNEDRVVYPR